VDPSYWRWRYVDNPFGKSGAIVALKDGRVVGKLGIVYMNVSVVGEIFLSGVMEGLAVEPAERSWAVFRAMIMKSVEVSMKEGVEFCFSFTTRPAAGVVGRIGAEIIGRMPIFSGFVDVKKTLAARGVPFPFSLAGLAAQPLVGVRTRALAPCKLEIRRVPAFDSSFDALWREAAPERTSIVKNAAHLEWRYAKCPIREYKKLAAYRGTKPVGLIVYMNWPKKNDGFILELMARKGDGAVMDGLLQTALEDLKKKGVGLASASFPEGSEAARALREAGFKSWASRFWDIQMTVATTRKRQAAPELVFSNWDYSLGDWLFH
jgi:hypothetical protein